MPERNDEDEEQLADRVLLQTWREWRRGVTREEAEAEAVAARESSPIFAGVAQPTSTGSSKAKSGRREAAHGLCRSLCRTEKIDILEVIGKLEEIF